jgi:hypothetical protein
MGTSWKAGWSGGRRGRSQETPHLVTAGTVSATSQIPVQHASGDRPARESRVLAGGAVEGGRERVISRPYVSCAAALAGNHATGSITPGHGSVAAIPATRPPHRPLAL